MSAEDDKLNLADVADAGDALTRAEEAMMKAIAGRGRNERDQFVYETDFALGRLLRVRSRIRGEEQEDGGPGRQAHIDPKLKS